MQKERSSKKPLFFYGFVIVLVGTFGILASVPGQSMGVSPFTDHIIESLKLSRNSYSWAYCFGTITSSFIIGIAGKWLDKYGARKVATLAALGLATALYLGSQSKSISDFIQNALNIDVWFVPFIVLTFCFFLIRFTGQGVLTLASRNVIMLWFDKYRGSVNAFSSIAVSLGFSISPYFVNALIEGNGWQGAWKILGAILIIVALIIYLTYRDKPEIMGLKPDGNLVKKKSKEVENGDIKQFTKKEALRTRAFWVYSLMLSFNAYFATGLTIHIASVFESVGLSSAKAFSVFVPMSIIALITSLIFNALSDHIKHKKLLFIMIAGGVVVSLGVAMLAHPIGYYLLILGSGVMSGMYAVLSAVAWPRFYGRKHLGAISGVNMQMIVFSSAIGAPLFSFSYYLFNSYAVVALSGLVGLALIAVFSIKADNPQ